MLNEINQRAKDTGQFHLYVRLKLNRYGGRRGEVGNG